MDAVQKQIITLSQKIDALYQIIEPLSRQVSESLSQAKQTTQPNSAQSTSIANLRGQDYQSQTLLNSVMEHKDVLSDGNAGISSYQNGESTLSAEIQVQRLTAQLTAAYNRIAALEEQLLARRIHS